MWHRITSYITHDGFGATLVRALAGSAGLRIVGMCFGMLVGVQLARGLGVEGYGLYGLAVSIISLIAIPVEFGLPQLLTREVAVAQARSDWSAINAILGWAFRIIFSAAVIVLIVGFLLFLIQPGFISISLMAALWAGSFFALLSPIGNVCGAALRGMQKIIAGQASEIVLRPVFHSALLFVGAFLLPGGLTPNIALIFQAVSVGGATVIAYFYLRRILPIGDAKAPTGAEKKKWLKSAASLALTEAMRIVHGNVAVIILGLMATVSVVGVFRVGSSMSSLIAMPISLMHIVLAPVFAKTYCAGDMRKLQKLSGWASVVMAGGVFILLTPFIFLGDWLMLKMFGHDFSGSSNILLIIGVGYIFGSLFGPGSIILNMIGHEVLATRLFGLSLLLQCILIVPLAYKFGAEGAAIANAMAYICWNIMTWSSGREVLKINLSIISLRDFKDI